MKQPDFLSKPMAQISSSEWEALCDGCGLCCQIREVDELGEEMALTNVACRFLCLSSHKCTDYLNKHANVADCIRITPQNVERLDWLPHSCAYRVVARGEELPDWHYLVCGDRRKVHEAGPSMLGELISEDDAGEYFEN